MSSFADSQDSPHWVALQTVSIHLNNCLVTVYIPMQRKLTHIDKEKALFFLFFLFYRFFNTQLRKKLILHQLSQLLYCENEGIHAWKNLLYKLVSLALLTLLNFINFIGFILFYWLFFFAKTSQTINVIT